MILKKLLELLKTFGAGLIVPLIVGILIGKGDAAKVPFAILFPDKDSIGGLTFPLARVPSAMPPHAGLELVLVRQVMKPTSKIAFLRRGSARPSDVFAGMAAERSGSATTLTGGVNGTRFLELEIPEKTLGGASLLTPDASQRARYVVTIGDVTKDLSDPDDLVIYTKNEARHVAFDHLLIGLTLIIVTFYLARAKPLRHPTQADLEDEQWV